MRNEGHIFSVVKGEGQGVQRHLTGALRGRRQEFGESKPEMRPNGYVSDFLGSNVLLHPWRLHNRDKKTVFPHV